MTAARRRRPMARPAAAPAPESDFELPEDRPQRLIAFQVENVLKIRAAHVNADGSHVIVIGGNNGQGKSSLCRALEMAICGRSVFPVKPVRDGAQYGTVKVTLTDLEVHLTVTHGGSTLRISDKHGHPIKKSPQKLLNQLFNELSFDPLKFAMMDPSQQDRELKRLAKTASGDSVEEAWAALDAEHDTIFRERTDVNRNVARLTAQVETMPWHDDAPKEEVSAKALFEQLKQMEEIQRSNDAVRKRADDLSLDLQTKVRLIRSEEETLEELEKEIAARRAGIAALRDDHATLLKREQAAQEEVEQLEDPNIESVRSKLENLDEQNRKFRENAARALAKKRLDEQSKEADAMTARLNSIKDEQLKLLENAKFPVPGLSFGEYGPAFNGVPIEQISTSERIRLSCAIGFAQNPKLKLLVVRDAAFLDAEGMRMMEQLAEEHDGLIILERVGTSDETAIIIEDGTVVQTPAAAE